MVCGAADPQLPPGLADGQDTGQDPAAGCPARGGQLLLDLASLRSFPVPSPRVHQTREPMVLNVT